MLNEIIKMIELSKNTKGQDWRHNIKQIKIKINEYAKEYHESEVKKLNIPAVSNSLHHPIKFGRWLLKNAKEHWEDGLLCWSYEGKSYNTEELFKIFCVQQ